MSTKVDCPFPPVSTRRNNPPLADNAFLPGALHRERVLETEVLSALRKQGISDVSDVEAILLVTDGSFSVVPKAAGDGEAIARVSRQID